MGIIPRQYPNGSSLKIRTYSYLEEHTHVRFDILEYGPRLLEILTIFSNRTCEENAAGLPLTFAMRVGQKKFHSCLTPTQWTPQKCVTCVAFQKIEVDPVKFAAELESYEDLKRRLVVDAALFGAVGAFAAFQVRCTCRKRVLYLL